MAVTAKPTRKEREYQRHRREILTAALELFSRQGFERTSMAEIADRAEFAVGTLYKFFKNKDALYRALILDTFQECALTLCKTLEAPGTEMEKLERFIEVKAELMVERIPAARIYVAQTAGAKIFPTVGFGREINTLYESILKSIESILREGIRKNIFVKVDPRMLAIALEGVANGFLLQAIDRPDDFNASCLAELTKQVFFDRVRLDSAS